MSGEQQAAFAAVYERHHRALLRYCRSIVGHDQDAQDALQSTMANALKALRDKPLDFDPQPWLFRIARNEAISILRRRRPTTELGADLVQLDEVHARAEAHETLRLLQQDLADLPERQRSALLLRELHGLASVQIGEMLGTTPGAVNQLILEARRALSHCAEGRATPCFDVQRAFSDGDGRVTRARKVRAHLRSCASCQHFRADLERRPRSLAALAPTLPGALSSLPTASAPFAAGLVAKVAVAVLVTATAATGVRELRHSHPAAAVAAPRPTVAAPREVVVRGASAPPSVPRPSGRRAPAAAPRRDRPQARREIVGQTPPAVAPATKGGRASAPREVKTPGATAPNQAKKAPAEKAAPAGGRATAPGQAKKAAPGGGRATAPGQAKKAAPRRGRATAPGQTGKTPAGQAKKQAAPPPGQADKDTAPPPGQARKDAAAPAAQRPAAAARGRRSPPSGATSAAS
jgi:RNA polymerase sigma factor (sigma-70 family)